MARAVEIMSKYLDKYQKMKKPNPRRQRGMGEADRIRFLQLRKQQRGYGLKLAGSGLTLAGSGLTLAGSGKYATHSMSGSGKCCRKKY